VNGMSTPEDERQSRSGSTRRTGAERPMFRSQLTLTLRGVVLIAVCNETDLGLFNICGGEVVLLVIAPPLSATPPLHCRSFRKPGPSGAGWNNPGFCYLWNRAGPPGTVGQFERWRSRTAKLVFIGPPVACGTGQTCRPGGTLNVRARYTSKLSARRTPT
jgi:hypothetical protein